MVLQILFTKYDEVKQEKKAVIEIDAVFKIIQ